MNLKNKIILVTGAGGFLGRHLCKALHYEEATVVGLKRKIEDNKYLTKQYAIDILNNNSVFEIIRDVKPEFVVHLAASKNRGVGAAAYCEGYKTNLMGSFNIINACRDIPVLKRFIFIGSTDEYGKLPVPFKESDKEAPINAYGASKLAVTELLRSLSRSIGFPSVILRPTIVYGPEQDESMFLPALIRSLILRKNFNMSLGEQSRDFIYVDDLVNSIIKALVKPDLKSDVINISSAVPIRINILAKTVSGILGNGSADFLKIGFREYQSSDVMQYWADNTLAKQLLEWSPMVSLEEGVERTVKYYKHSV